MVTLSESCSFKFSLAMRRGHAWFHLACERAALLKHARAERLRIRESKLGVYNSADIFSTFSRSMVHSMLIIMLIHVDNQKADQVGPSVLLI